MGEESSPVACEQHGSGAVDLRIRSSRSKPRRRRGVRSPGLNLAKARKQDHGVTFGGPFLLSVPFT